MVSTPVGSVTITLRNVWVENVGEPIRLDDLLSTVGPCIYGQQWERPLEVLGGLGNLQRCAVNRGGLIIGVFPMAWSNDKFGTMIKVRSTKLTWK
ncbi:hypothetical protein FOPE_09175 [Fonsecaea pedrosoi]|nr:hypothetical protein FOPE_09175 [Fonsecaea pedrosoi]